MTRKPGGKWPGPPKGEPWVWLTRELLKSAAWRGLGVNAGRVIHFLLLEHMAHGGKENGKLKAPHRQLKKWGVSSRLAANAIREAEERGLVIAHRAGMRTPTTYTLTWLPLHDGDMPYAAWRYYKPGLTPEGKAALTPEGKATLTSEGRGPKTALTSEARSAPTAALRSEVAINRSYHSGSLSTDSRHGEEPLGSESDEEADA